MDNQWLNRLQVPQRRAGDQGFLLLHQELLELRAKEKPQHSQRAECLNPLPEKGSLSPQPALVVPDPAWAGHPFRNGYRESSGCADYSDVNDGNHTFGDVPR